MTAKPATLCILSACTNACQIKIREKKAMAIRTALAGNPNCGKTTLFNTLTGSRQHIGNFPGVTVEKKSGVVKGCPEMTATDLPGIYSLSPYSSEEIITRDFLIDDKPDVLINIIDATSPERGLYLTLQLAELEIPMVAALNMMDEVRDDGGSIDTERLSKLLGMTVVGISAADGEGIDRLVEAVRLAAKSNAITKIPMPGTPVNRTISTIQQLIAEKARSAQIPPQFSATKLVEGDEAIAARLQVSESEKAVIRSLTEELELTLGTHCEEAVADMRYSFIESVCSRCITKAASKGQLRSEKIDRLLTHRALGIPIFIGIMLLIFWLTFSVIGVPLRNMLEDTIALGTERLGMALAEWGVARWLSGLITEGICAGVGSVLSFMPVILLLFFFLSLLEDSGYMARGAFLMDALLKKLGLSGRSFVPLLMGFGCSVPAIMSARTLSSSRDRWLTVLITPFMSCGAKLPIYAMITAAFFPTAAPAVMTGLYAAGIAAAIGTGFVMKATFMKGEAEPFVMELPAYRMPSMRSVLMLMWEKARDFVVRAFTVILTASVVIWLLRSFDFGLNLVSDSSDSILASVGSFIAPIFAPLGFGDWRAATALITGVTAKETVVSTLTVLTGSSASLADIFTPPAAISFLVFVLLYMPCVAAFAAMKRELGLKRALFSVGYETALAYTASLLVYQIGMLIFA